MWARCENRASVGSGGGGGRLQPHLVAEAVFVHSGLPAQPSGFRVRFEKTTSESAAESCRHDSARVETTNEAQPRVFGTNRLSQQRSCRICRDDYKRVAVSTGPLRSAVLSACCHPPLAIIQTHTNPRSSRGFCPVQSGLKRRRQPAPVSARTLSRTQRLSSFGYQVIDMKWSITY